MRKTAIAAVTGLLLIAGQAAAAGSTSSARVGDRVGARADASSEFAGIPLPVLLIGTAVVIGAVVVASNDDSDSN
tara:strand:- start:5150 stop:5374 length:225 start_codon:yes stop_codon:yes gene_type:complete